MKITKKIINTILKEYSVSKNDFTQYLQSENEITFRHNTITGYLITILPEVQFEEETGRFIARHTSSNGKIQYIDTWKQVNNSVEFITRDTPKSMSKKADYEYVKDLEQDIENLKKAYRELLESKECVNIIDDKYTNAKKRVGRPQIDESIANQIIADCNAGMKKTEIAKKYGIERKTIYNLLKRV